RRLDVGAPLLGKVGIIAVAQTSGQGGAIDVAGHLVAEDPWLAIEIAVGVGDGILHEGEATFGKRTGDDVGLSYGLGGAGELSIEIDGGIVLAGFGKHEGIDALRAGKLLEIRASALDGSDVAFLGE